jgi:hypothetical protein
LDTICLFTSVKETIADLISNSPNPVTSNLTIEVKSGNINSINIFNLLGEKQLAVNLFPVNRLLSIDVSSLSPGLYFIRAETEHGQITSKFIKE